MFVSSLWVPKDVWAEENWQGQNYGSSKEQQFYSAVFVKSELCGLALEPDIE